VEWGRQAVKETGGVAERMFFVLADSIEVVEGLAFGTGQEKRGNQQAL